MQASPRSRSIKIFKPLMSRMLLLLFFVFNLFIATTVHAQTPTPDVIVAAETSPQVKATEKARSIVRGRVVYDDTNRPVRRARVMLLNLEGGGPEKNGTTNERGEFRIPEVGAGSYVVMVDAPGIITPFSLVDMDESLDERAAAAQIKSEFESVSVNGTNSVEVQVKARRGGVITGRVTYSDGDPAVNAQIVIMRKKEGRFVRFLLTFNPSGLISFKTDDRGIYRIAGLPPGEYIIGAAEASARQDMRDDFAGLKIDSLTMSYYQNETSLRAATAIKIEAGQESSNINVTLIERALYTLSGMVVARQGRTPVRARLSIQAKTGATSLPFFDGGPSTQTDEEGRWSFGDVPDGTYVIMVEPTASYEEEAQTTTTTISTENTNNSQPPPQPSRPRSLVRKQQDVTVSGGDLSGVVIELGEGGRIQGTVTVEGNKEVPAEASVLLSTPDGKQLMDRYGFIQQDGKFSIDAIPPGEFYLRLIQPSAKYYVKSMTSGSTDLLREFIKIGPGTNIESVHVVLSSEVATLEGRVLSAEDKKPVRGASVLVVPAEPARWRFVAAYLFGFTDADGAFTVAGAPGTYLVIPLAAGERLGINEALVRQRAASAKQVTLQPNQRTTVEVTAPSAPQR